MRFHQDVEGGTGTFKKGQNFVTNYGSVGDECGLPHPPSPTTVTTTACPSSGTCFQHCTGGKKCVKMPSLVSSHVGAIGLPCDSRRLSRLTHRGQTGFDDQRVGGVHKSGANHMDVLTDIWTVWNQQVGATLATLLAAFALLKATGSGIRQVVSDVRQWKGWAILARLFKSVKTRYRVWRAKGVMRQSMEGQRLTIGIQVYDSCLQDDPSKSTREQLEAITPAKPSWLNDYYVATALESLSNEGKVGKAKRYDVNAWPPRAFRYDFEAFVSVEAAHEEVVKIETTDYCVIYQLFEYCRRETRFDFRHIAETVAPNRVTHNTAYVLKDAAPSCELCWEKDQQERDIRNLVENITKYDLAYEATENITGTEGELQEAVITACIESQCPAEPDLIREEVKQAIEIRQGHTAQDVSRPKHEWSPDEHQELVAALKKYISSQMN